jgi:hypothetical protein
MTVKEDMEIRVVSFATESGYDKLTIGAQRYSGNDAGDLHKLILGRGGEIQWRTDSSVTKRGWLLETIPLDELPPGRVVPATPAPTPPVCLAGGADLTVDEEIIKNTLRVDELNSADVDPCYVEEGCLGGTGDRRLLRFTTRVNNIGCEDFFIGRTPNNINDIRNGFKWHTCHAHWHYENYAYYSLSTLCEGQEVAWENRPVVGHKNGWCVMDLGRLPGHQCRMKYDCDRMGISAGCSDTYARNLDCQWIDITDVSPGIYWLMVATNWDEQYREGGLIELNYENNAAWVAVEITANRARLLRDPQGVKTYEQMIRIVERRCARGSVSGFPGGRRLATGRNNLTRMLQSSAALDVIIL